MHTPAGDSIAGPTSSISGAFLFVLSSAVGEGRRQLLSPVEGRLPGTGRCAGGAVEFVERMLSIAASLEASGGAS